MSTSQQWRHNVKCAVPSTAAPMIVAIVRARAESPRQTRDSYEGERRQSVIMAKQPFRAVLSSLKSSELQPPLFTAQPAHYEFKHEDHA